MTRRRKSRKVPRSQASGVVDELVNALRRAGYTRIRLQWPGVIAVQGRWRYIWCSRQSALAWLADATPRRRAR